MEKRCLREISSINKYKYQVKGTKKKQSDIPHLCPQRRQEVMGTN